MTDAQDDRRRGLFGWHPWLIVLIVLGFAPRAVDDVVGDLATQVTASNPWRFWFPLATGACEIAGLLAAGVLVDRYGIRIVMSVSLAAWAVVLAIMAVFVRATPTLYLMHVGALLVGLPFSVAGNVAAKHVVPSERRARFLAVLDLAATASLLAVRPVAAAAGWPPAQSSSPAWAAGGLMVAGGASALAALWWISRLAEIEPVPGGRRFGAAPYGADPSLVDALALLRRPGMLALVFVMACHLSVFATLYRVLPLYVLNFRFLPYETFTQTLVAPLLLYAAAKLVMAFWSDARARRTGRSARARVPFVVVGALLATTIGLIPLVGNAGLGTIFWPLAVGMAIFPAVFPLGLDVVPTALAGRFLGLALAVSLAVNLAIFVLDSIVSSITHDLAAYFYAAAFAAITGAALSLAGLRKLQPVEDDQDLAQAIGKVFA